MIDYEGMITLVLNDTLKKKLIWGILRESSVYRAYSSKINLTPRKKLEIVVNCFTTGNQLSHVIFYLMSDGERIKINDVGFHFAARPIHELVNILEEKYKRGDFKIPIL